MLLDKSTCFAKKITKVVCFYFLFLFHLIALSPRVVKTLIVANFDSFNLVSNIGPVSLL